MQYQQTFERNDKVETERFFSKFGDEANNLNFYF